ncbi:MAG: TrkA-N domain protein [Acidimicrobiales bacterium]|nr:TrkA-N domain protein [Acidimicrobiales bacterium]
MSYITRLRKRRPTTPREPMRVKTVIPTRRERARYWLDSAFARGTTTLIRLLGLATLALVVVAGLALWLAHINTGDSSRSFIEGGWLSLLRTMDPGTMGSDSGWPFRLISLCVTIGGIFLVSSLIGLLASGIDARLADLRRGRSRVIERGHVLILGWSPKLGTLLTELAAASANQIKDHVVVILADRDKVDMESDVRRQLPGHSHLRVVCRTGNAADPHDLALVAAVEAKTILVLNPDAAGDAQSVRCVLALAALGVQPETSIVVELNDASRADALRSATDIDFVPIVSHDWIARIIAQVCRLRELGTVYRDLLDFAGDEVYFEPIPEALIGGTFFDLARGCRGGALIGRASAAGKVDLAPASTTVIARGDQAIVIAADDGVTSFEARAALDVPHDTTRLDRMNHAPDHIGILGWSPLGLRVLKEFDQFLPLDSVVDVFYDDAFEMDAPLPAERYQRFELRQRSGDTTNARAIENLVRQDSLDCLLLLCNRSELAASDADARVLLTMLEARHIMTHGHSIRVVAELADESDIVLVGERRLEEFIVGEQISALLMAQISENRSMAGVFDELLAADGAELDVVPAHAIVPIGEATTVADLAARTAARSMYLIGIAQHDTVTLNPAQDLPLVCDDDLRLVVMCCGDQ